MFANAMALSLRVHSDHPLVGWSIAQLVPNMAFQTLALMSIFIARALKALGQRVSAFHMTHLR